MLYLKLIQLDNQRQKQSPSQSRSVARRHADLIWKEDGNGLEGLKYLKTHVSSFLNYNYARRIAELNKTRKIVGSHLLKCRLTHIVLVKEATN